MKQNEGAFILTTPQEPQEAPEHIESSQYQQPDQPSARPPKAARVARTAMLVVAAVWLIASVAAGVWLIAGTETAAVHLKATRPTLTSQSTHTVYGGDAYTGIQNAASDTERAVVNGANGLADITQQLADSSAEFNRGLVKRVQQGLGILIIGVGLVNFTIALSRSAAI